jgi:hypothetical protein
VFRSRVATASPKTPMRDELIGRYAKTAWVIGDFCAIGSQIKEISIYYQCVN